MRVNPASVLVCLCALACALLAGCSPLPQTGRESIATKAAPQLLPIDQLLAAAADAPGGASAAQGEALAARAARLRARAGLMRGPVMEPETRARLDAAIAAGKA
jgi:hypothetical protein